MKFLDSKKGKVALPCLDVQIVSIDEVQANNYNPNAVPKHNMKLLETSILANGFCFPVVTIYDPDLEKYVIVDGFHRYTIFKDYLQAKELPIIVLEQTIAQRMEATVQFNRARGVHQVELMGELVKSLLEQGLKEEEIAEKLGMELEEVLRLSQVVGVAGVFKNQKYSMAWEMREIDESA